MNDAYCVLGVSRDDTEDEIKKAVADVLDELTQGDK